MSASAKRRDRRRLLVAAAVVAVGFIASAPFGHAQLSDGPQLLMFEEAGCPWCLRWHQEVGPGYPKSTEGQVAPLRRLDIRERLPAGITLTLPVRATPTFVLIEHGREVGRITGYPGADFFWGLLDGLMKKLDRATLPSQDRHRAI